MPTYTCEKCARVFKQKSGFNDHMKKKNDCSASTVLNTVVDAKVAIAKEEVKREVIRELNPYSELVLPEDKAQRDAVLQKFFEDLHNLLWNRAGLSPERALEHLTFFFAYRLIESQADTLALPQECRWSYLASHKNENDTYETMKKGCVAFQKNKITKPFFKKPEIDKADIVFEVIRQISRIPLKALQESDTLGNIFEYMLGRGMSTMSDEGQYFTNRTICALAFKLAYGIKKTLRRSNGSLCTFADWFCGTGGFPAEYVKGVKANLSNVDWKKECGAVYCQDMNLSSVTTTLLNMLILTGIPFSGDKIRGSNSFSDPITTGAGAPFPGLTVDYCFMNPPYGGDKSKGKEYKFAYAKKIKAEDGTTSKKFFVNAEIQSIGIEDDEKVSAGVQLAMATLSADGGVCSIVLPQGFFFGASKKRDELRKKIAEEYKIWYVVDIASGSFINTGTKTSMMVFQRGVGATEKVSFIGLDETVLVEATLEELRAKHYSLNYKQYLPQSTVEVEGFETVKLGDIAEIRYGTRITQAKDAGTLYPAYGGGGLMTYNTDKFNRDGTTYKVSRDGMSQHNCVMKIIGKYFCNDTAITVHAKEATRALDGYIGEWLLLQKTKIYNDCSRGTAQLHIDLDTLLSLQIPLPSIERQQQIVEAIDGWTNLAQNEEVSLKMLEKQMMFQVKEMGKGQARVKLGDVIVADSGDLLAKDSIVKGDYPIIGGGRVVGYHNKTNRNADEIVISRVGNACLTFMSSKYYLTDNALAIISKNQDKMLVKYLYYYLTQNVDKLREQYSGTAQPVISKTRLYEIEIPLPPLTEQQTLQSDFDEIRHKHAKIATYKAKAQEAIQRLIPGAT
jgi:type I restriction-modification system DNA methylase subunit/restriction endonuclease S subunit